MSALRIALAQINTVVRDLGGNSTKILDSLDVDNDKNLHREY
jgi:hypothetical protein